MDKELLSAVGLYAFMLRCKHEYKVYKCQVIRSYKVDKFTYARLYLPAVPVITTNPCYSLYSYPYIPLPYTLTLILYFVNLTKVMGQKRNY